MGVKKSLLAAAPLKDFTKIERRIKKAEA